jgi:hypothetical protein
MSETPQRRSCRCALNWEVPNFRATVGRCEEDGHAYGPNRAAVVAICEFLEHMSSRNATVRRWLFRDSRRLIMLPPHVNSMKQTHSHSCTAADIESVTNAFALSSGSNPPLT